MGTGHEANRGGHIAHGCAPIAGADVCLSVGLSTGAQINLANYRVQRLLGLSEYRNAWFLPFGVAPCDE